MEELNLTAYPCEGLTQEFEKVYGDLPFDSGICFEVWKLVKQFEAILQYTDVKGRLVQAHIHLTPELKESLTNEAVLFTGEQGRVFTAFSQAIGFIKRFIITSKSDADLILASDSLKPDIGPDVINAMRERLNERKQEYKAQEAITMNFASALMEWKTFLAQELWNSAPDKMEALNEFVRSTVLNEIGKYRHHEKTHEILSTFLARMKFFPKKRMSVSAQVDIQMIIFVMEDIISCYGSSAELGLAVKVARERFDRLFPQFGNVEDTTGDGITSLPSKIGPFGVQKVAYPEDKNGMYSIKVDHIARLMYITCERNDGTRPSFTIQLSHRSTAVLMESQAVKLEIPKGTNVNWCYFVYPACYESNNLQDAVTDDPANGYSRLMNDVRALEIPCIFSLMENGGFIYLADDDQIVGIHALNRTGKDLFCIKPYELENFEIRFPHKIFRPVHQKALVDQGIKEMTWMGPGELGTVNNGGFVFKVQHEGKRKAYIMFNVVDKIMGMALRGFEAVEHTESVGKDESLLQIIHLFNKEIAERFQGQNPG